jgi:hypothetical protein
MNRRCPICPRVLLSSVLARGRRGFRVRQLDRDMTIGLRSGGVLGTDPAAAIVDHYAFTAGRGTGSRLRPWAVLYIDTRHVTIYVMSRACHPHPDLRCHWCDGAHGALLHSARIAAAP